jgi:hypothetical protein
MDAIVLFVWHPRYSRLLPDGFCGTCEYLNGLGMHGRSQILEQESIFPRRGSIMRVRVVTLNVWNTEGDPRRLDLINRELRTLAPDLLALQEVVQTDDRNSLLRLLDA